MAEIRQTFSPQTSGISVLYDMPAEAVMTTDYANNFLKSKLNVSDADLIADYVKSATEDSERTVNRVYITRSVTILYQYIVEKVWIPIAPVNSITSVTAINPFDGTETILYSAIDYTAIGDTEKYIIVKGYAGYSLKIVCNAGYGTTYASMPSWVRDAVTARMGYKYAVQPMDMAMYKKRFMDAESLHKFWYVF